jgi:hypothetical protein
VWLAEFDDRGRPASNVSVNDPMAILADNSRIRGGATRFGSNLICLQLSCFSRDSNDVKLLIDDGMTSIRLKVKNPRPVFASRPSAKTLPQTNDSIGARMILSAPRGDRFFTRHGETFEAHLRLQSIDGSPAGWTYWRVTAFDALGNWTQHGTWSRYPGQVTVGLIPTWSEPWKLLAEAQEYISAGFVPYPTNDMSVILLSARAQALGLERVVFVGRGRYRINGLETRPGDRPTEFLQKPSLAFAESTKTNWAVELQTPSPGVLLVLSENAPATITARVRERMGADRGRIFGNVSMVAATNTFSSKRIATFFAPRLPNITTNLEVELIALLPPTEFFVMPPQRWNDSATR